MPWIKEAPVSDDSENPAIRKLDRQHLLTEDGQAKPARCSFAFLRRGWFWAVVLTIAAVCTAVPIGVKMTRQLNAVNTDPPQYKFNTTGWNPGALKPAPFDAAAEGYKPTCGDLMPELPTVNVLWGQPPPALQLDGPRLVTVDGNKTVNLHGVNWPGFNTPATMVAGLTVQQQQQPTWETSDFTTVSRQLRLFGFNAVRLPFTFSTLFEAAPVDIRVNCSGAPPSMQQLQQRTAPPDNTKAANRSRKALPQFVTPDGYGSSGCNGYMPSSPTTLTRYLWVVQHLVNNGFYVVLDYHPDSQGEAHLNSTTTFSNSWARLWMALSCLPNGPQALQGRVFLDLLNEPDAVGITWSGSKSDSQQSLGDLYLAVMDKIEALTPTAALYFIQGAGQSSLGLSWGDGFTTDSAMLQKRKLPSPSTFLQQLLQSPYGSRTVLAPHAYGPSLTKSPIVGKSLWAALSASWGYVQRSGYCFNGTSTTGCFQLPVAIGEMGTVMSSTADEQYYTGLAKYMAADPAAAEFKPVAFSNWFWWAYPSSVQKGGGLVAADGAGWDWAKLDWLVDNMGLQSATS